MDGGRWGGRPGTTPLCQYKNTQNTTLKELHQEKFFKLTAPNQYISHVNNKSVVPHHPPPCPPVNFLFRAKWMQKDGEQNGCPNVAKQK